MNTKVAVAAPTGVSQHVATILVVNDDPVQLRLTEHVLTRHGYAVRLARSAEMGLEALKEFEIDALITDLNMPGIDGWRFCRLLRSPEYQPFNQLPILVVSATYCGDDAEQLTVELGAHGFLPAPFEATKLIAHVRNMLSGATAPRRMSVLIAHPESSTSDQLRLVFFAHGYDTIMAHTLDEALEAYRRDDPGIVVLDADLPQDAIRAFLTRMNTPLRRAAIIVTASEVNASMALETMRVGADHFIRAPYDANYVVAMSERSRRARALLRVEALLEERTRRLRDSEARLRAILRAMPEMLLVYTPEGKILHANHAAAKILEYAVTYLPGQSMLDLVASDDRDRLRERLASRENGASSYVVSYRTASGQTLPFEVTEHRLMFGGRDAIVGMMRDLTDRLPIDEERALLSAALEQSGDVFLVTALDGTIRYANRAFEAVTGFARTEAVGSNVSALSVDKAQWRELASTIARGETWAGRMTRKRKDGTTYVSNSTVSPIVDKSGVITSVVGVERDVTREEELQGALVQAQKMEAVGTLAGGIAHDFNNLLTGILGYASLLRRLVPTDGEIPQMVEIIESSAIRAAQLTQQLLGFARRGKNRNVTVDLNETARQVVKLLSRTIDKRIQLVTDLHFGSLCADGDPTQLEQSILNLALNARDAVAHTEAPQIALRTAKFTMDLGFCERHPGATPGNYVVCEVKDNGMGIEPTVMKRIFEPFFTTKPSGKGTGMGLSMVYGIVKAHGGYVSATSELDEGSVFRMYLPIAMQDPVPEPKPRTKLHYGQGRILLVDDESVIRQTASSMLRRLGYDVVAFEHGGEALTFFREFGKGVQLAIVDMMMPGMDGSALTRALLKLAPQLPIILSTGYGLNDAAQSILDAGASNFAPKPYNWPEFSRVVADTIAPSDPDPPAS